MTKKLINLGFEVAFNPPGDGDCFYFSAANALGIETQQPEECGLRLPKEPSVRREYLWLISLFRSHNQGWRP